MSKIEQLRQVKELKANNPYAKQIHSHILQVVVVDLEQAFHAFFRRVKAGLEGKAAEAGRTIVVVPPAYTSQTCSGCGAVLEHLTLLDRWANCGCGLSLARDHNAAINILRLGRSLWELT